MTDLHTHLLPGMDNGSESMEQTLDMLRLCAAQGIRTVVATPHFNLQKETIAAFAARRAAAIATVTQEVGWQVLPTILPGAEVFFDLELCHCEELSTLCLAGSNAMLLEFPMSPWNRQLLGALYQFICTSGVTVVIAHAERYFRTQSRGNLKNLLAMGALLQADADFFISPRTRKKALRLLSQNRIHFIASDCHSSQLRPPNLGNALNVISGWLGVEAVNRLASRTRTLIHLELE
ncbi:MAG: CpsB/CapC family capsule biosynthesis tyrosine phosphatase [Oscillospiraceae bacterium]